MCPSQLTALRLMSDCCEWGAKILLADLEHRAILLVLESPESQSASSMNDRLTLSLECVLLYPLEYRPTHAASNLICFLRYCWRLYNLRRGLLIKLCSPEVQEARQELHLDLDQDLQEVYHQQSNRHLDLIYCLKDSSLRKSIFLSLNSTCLPTGTPACHLICYLHSSSQKLSHASYRMLARSLIAERVSFHNSNSC